MMEIPELYLPGFELDLDSEKQLAFDVLLEKTKPGAYIDYQLPFPKWQFLTYLCETRPVVLHGSQQPGISVVEPRQARDIRDFSNQRAIYATTDGIWVIYFAILDRKNHPGISLFNACFRYKDGDDQWSHPFYFFSISHAVRIQHPWIMGTIYILPRHSFIKEPNQQIMGATVDFPHWVSSTPAEPLAKLLVGMEDFPFLSQIHGHDDALLEKLVKENPQGFPWPEALIS